MAVGNPISLTDNVASRIVSQIATESQTDFTISGGYRINAISVYRNGVRLVSGRDYSAADGSTVVLLSGASLSDVLEFHIFDDFRVADAIVSNASYQNIEGNLNIAGILTVTTLNLSSLTVTDSISIGGTLTYEDVTNVDSIGIITARTDLHVGAGLSVVGVSTLSGSVDLGSNGNTDTITATGRFDSDLVPSNDDERDIGSSSLEWRDLYIDGTGNIDTLVSGDGTFSTNLGIGTANPTNYGGAVKLALSSDGHTGLTIAAGTSSDSNIFFADGTAGDATYRGNIKYAHDGDSMRFSTAAEERLRITSAGLIGIGTTNPAAKLEIKTTNEAALYITDSSNGNNSPYIRVLGKRSDGNIHQSFTGQLFLASLRTDQKIASGKKLGTVLFGGNHTNTSEANVLYAASIAGVASSDFDSETDMPTDLVFYTGSTGRAPAVANVSSGTEKLRITSDGLVGIGTDNPEVKLEIVDSTVNRTWTPTSQTELLVERNGNCFISAIGSTTGNSILNFGDSDDENAGSIDYDHADDSMGFRVNGAERLGISSTGRISQIANNEDIDMDANASGQLKLDGNGYNAGLALNAEGLNIYTNSATRGIIFGTNETERVRIKPDGSVGIGTDDPTSDFDVHRSGSASAIIDGKAGDGLLTLRNAGNGNWSGINFTRERNTGTNVVGGSIWMPSNTSNNGASLYIQTQTASANAGVDAALTDNNGVRIKLASQPGGQAADSAFSVEVGSKERLRVAADGSVGIGTDNPNGRFHIHSSTAGSVTAATDANELVLESSANVGMSFLTANNSLARIKFGDPDAANAGIIIYSHADDSFRFQHTSNERLRISSDGKIGIGAASPVTDVDISQKTGAVALPQGTTAQRPSGSSPYIRYNTTNSALEFYNGTDWVEIITDYFPTGSTILG